MLNTLINIIGILAIIVILINLLAAIGNKSKKGITLGICDVVFWIVLMWFIK